MNVQRGQDREIHERSLELAATAIDFELTRVEAIELETHLATCPTCARLAAAMRGDALALGRPMTLLPSARVDAAIAAEIAGRRAGSGPQRLVLVAAAALLALALLGAAAVGAYLLRNATTPPITDVTPVTPPVVASPLPDASPVAIGETWGTMDFAPGSGGSIEAVALSGADLIGVGRGECIPAGGPPTQCYAGAWTGTLGETWVRVPDQPDLEIGAAVGTSAPAARILDVATGQGTTLAIGYADDGRARVWRSTDGLAWQRAELDPGSPGGVARVGAVLARPDGFLVVGWVVADTQESARAAVWSTSDGVDWTRSPDTAEMDVGACFIAGDDLSCGGMLGVVRTPSGFVAVGSTHAGLAGTEPSRPVTWTSPDGLAWTQSRAGLDFVGLLSDVAVGGPGLVAVGTTCPPGCFEPTAGAVAATSVDGVTWTFTKVAGATGPQRVASIGQRVFAIGFLNGDVEPFGDLQVWQTDDGVAWQRMTGIPSTTDRYGGADIAASNGRLVIVGWQSVTGVDGTRNFAYVNPPVGPAPAVDATVPPDASPVASPDIGAIDPVVALRVNITSDTGTNQYPSMTVYRDGTVVSQGGAMTRLTTDGLALLMAPALQSDLLVTSGEIDPDPAYVGGGAGSSIELLRGDVIVRRATIHSDAVLPGQRAEADRIIALAEQLVDHDSWLPADAWAIGPTAGLSYSPTRFLLKLAIEDGPGRKDLALDVADVDWPLPGRLEGFGQVEVEAVEGWAWRCGPVTKAEALAVQHALAAAPLRPEGEHLDADLDWTAARKHLTVSLIPLLPDDPFSCAVDGLAP